MSNEPWHGTNGGYINHKCKCARCSYVNKVTSFSSYHNMPAKIIIYKRDLDKLYPYIVKLNGTTYIGKEADNLFAYEITEEGEFIIFETLTHKLPKTIARTIKWTGNDS